MRLAGELTYRGHTVPFELSLRQYGNGRAYLTLKGDGLGFGQSGTPSELQAGPLVEAIANFLHDDPKFRKALDDLADSVEVRRQTEPPLEVPHG